MGYISEEKYKARLKKIQKKNASKERKRKLKEEKGKYKFKLKLPSTSKLILLVVFLLCLQIVFFCQYVILTTGDTSALYTMIGVVASSIPIVLGYYFKSKAENTSGGITYDMAMAEFEQNCVDDYTEISVGEILEGIEQ